MENLLIFINQEYQQKRRNDKKQDLKRKFCKDTFMEVKEITESPGNEILP